MVGNYHSDNCFFVFVTILALFNMKNKLKEELLHTALVLNLESGLQVEFVSVTSKTTFSVEANEVVLWDSLAPMKVFQSSLEYQIKTQFLSFGSESFEIEPVKKVGVGQLLKISFSTEWLERNDVAHYLHPLRNSPYDFPVFPSFFHSLQHHTSLFKAGSYVPTTNSLLLKSLLFNYLDSFWEILKNTSSLENDSLKMDWIVQNYMSEFGKPIPTIAELSQELGMSESKFKYLFKEHFGMPFYQFYQQRRMQQASQWLKSGKWNVAEVAQRLGYANSVKFITQFKKSFGQTPLRYKKNKTRG